MAPACPTWRVWTQLMCRAAHASSNRRSCRLSVDKPVLRTRCNRNADCQSAQQLDTRSSERGQFRSMLLSDDASNRLGVSTGHIGRTDACDAVDAGSAWTWTPNIDASLMYYAVGHGVYCALSAHLYIALLIDQCSTSLMTRCM